MTAALKAQAFLLTVMVLCFTPTPDTLTIANWLGKVKDVRMSRR
jgi:hypothetical protein